MALIKVNADSVSRSKVLEIANIFRVNIVDIGVESLTMEISGGKQKINSLIELLKQFGIKEILRTGRIATLRGTLIEGEDDGIFQSEQDNDNNFIIPTESGSV